MNILSRGKYIRSSTQKLRLIANLIRGKNVIIAYNILSFINKKSAFLIKKVLKSAISNALHNFGINKDILKISKIYIDNASFLKRINPRAKGRVNYILKRSSHITIIVSDK